MSSQTGSQATVEHLWWQFDSPCCPAPCACSRGRSGDSWMSMTVSFGAEAEGAARASSGRLLYAKPKIGCDRLLE
eukprot:scaffold6293_cov133-Isochrysis_galbana.AAC.2